MRYGLHNSVGSIIHRAMHILSYYCLGNISPWRKPLDSVLYAPKTAPDRGALLLPVVGMRSESAWRSHRETAPGFRSDPVFSRFLKSSLKSLPSILLELVLLRFAS